MECFSKCPVPVSKLFLGTCFLFFPRVSQYCGPIQSTHRLMECCFTFPVPLSKLFLGTCFLFCPLVTQYCGPIQSTHRLMECFSLFRYLFSKLFVGEKPHRGGHDDDAFSRGGGTERGKSVAVSGGEWQVGIGQHLAGGRPGDGGQRFDNDRERNAPVPQSEVRATCERLYPVFASFRQQHLLNLSV